VPRERIEARGARRDTRPLRPIVRQQVERLLAVSPDGRTMAELQYFLVTQRPASRDTIARVLSDLVTETLVHVSTEPPWRRRARLRTRKPLRGRAHHLYVPTRALHERVRSWFLLESAPAADSSPSPDA
jgi:hypothetical protein